ncbi:triosephosphate isomerase [Conyzicola lurida]|uniref:Triosephosphate isomerase n=1 Tax=Conyzicola lurida TaxID=1172621 RepID=A0A841ALP3_9MICO|nr:triose-phosphate isomerase family protein [Conyzicola lurida]MBB5842349.1 triosephosphate isomerase [Conyzicola lurida]
MTDRRATVGVSLKMYFGHAQTLAWCAEVARVAREHDGVDVFVIPDFVSIVDAVRVFDGSGVTVGAQALSWDDAGALTGEVSGSVLAEVGVGVVEVGHAERRRIFGETEAIVASKTAAALRNGLAPVLCIGEITEGPADAAADECLRQLEDALNGAPAGKVIVAYEPVWAIGAAQPAPTSHIRAVSARLRAAVADWTDRDGSVVIYGGSAGPGLLTELGDDVDGVFLGRFAHDPAALAAVLQEATR